MVCRIQKHIDKAPNLNIGSTRAAINVRDTIDITSSVKQRTTIFIIFSLSIMFFTEVTSGSVCSTLKIVADMTVR